jgi:tRNA threonylcarbamoyl adenosine modification protein YeaZ
VRLADRRALSREVERVAAALLAARGASARDLAAILVADGPGSFTGLRIGAAFAKGLWRALGVPLLTAPSLLGAAVRAAGAAGGERPVEVVACYDALRGECHRAVYRLLSDGVELVDAVALVDVAAAHAAAPWGALRASETEASAAALLGLVGVAGGPVPIDAPSAWEPAYGRPAEAEAKRLREGRAAPRA